MNSEYCAYFICHYFIFFMSSKETILTINIVRSNCEFICDKRLTWQIFSLHPILLYHFGNQPLFFYYLSSTMLIFVFSQMFMGNNKNLNQSVFYKNFFSKFMFWVMFDFSVARMLNLIKESQPYLPSHI